MGKRLVKYILIMCTVWSFLTLSVVLLIPEGLKEIERKDKIGFAIPGCPKNYDGFCVRCSGNTSAFQSVECKDSVVEFLYNYPVQTWESLSNAKYSILRGQFLEMPLVMVSYLFAFLFSIPYLITLLAVCVFTKNKIIKEKEK